MFFYKNVNPDGNVEEDCVTRAISLSVGLQYQTISKLLNLTASHYECDKLCVCCYHNLLEDIFGFAPHYAKRNETVQDVAEMYPNNKVIIRIDGHLTCSMYGVVTDIWDCSDMLVDCYWIVP